MKIISVLVLLLILALPTFAQDEQNTRNYCAGTILYDLPEGWVVGEAARNVNYTSVKIASTSRALDKNPLDLDASDAVITLGVGSRMIVTTTLNVAADANLETILLALTVSYSSNGYTLSDVQRQPLGDRATAYIEAHTAANDQYVFVSEVDRGAMSILFLSSSATGSDHWKDTAVNVMKSLVSYAPPFAQMEGSPAVTQTFSNEDCSVVFAYPAGWNLGTLALKQNEIFSVQMESFLEQDRTPSTLLKSGQVAVTLSMSPIAPSQINSSAIEDYYVFLSQHPGTKILSRTVAVINGNPAIVTEAHVVPQSPKLGGDTLIIIVFYNNVHASATFILYSAPGELEQWRNTTLAIAESLQVNPPEA